MLRVALLALLCLARPLAAQADALDETLQPFCTQSAIAPSACKCAGDVMRRAIPAREMEVIVRFARNQLTAEEVAKLPDGGAALRGKFADGWRQAQAECGVRNRQGAATAWTKIPPPHPILAASAGRPTSKHPKSRHDGGPPIQQRRGRRPMLAIRSAAGALAILMSVGVVSAQDQDLLGVWWTEKNKGRVEIVKCAAPKQGLCGTIIWISEPNDKEGKPQTDKGNKMSASGRGRSSACRSSRAGSRAADKWKGSVYDPEDGQDYDIDITLAGDKLTLRGCIAFLCDSDEWNRYRP